MKTFYYTPRLVALADFGRSCVGGPCCSPWQSDRQDIGYRNRSAVLLDLDDFFGTLFAGLVEEDVIDDTYVFFRCVALSANVSYLSASSD